MEITVHSTEETKKLAQQLASEAKKGDIFALYGDLGSGKTTFTRYFVEALGVPNRVQSPTFIIHRVYENDKLTLNHFDLYRLTSIDEVEDMGFREILEDPYNISIIEWPNIAESILENYSNKLIRIYFKSLNETDRLITIKKYE